MIGRCPDCRYDDVLDTTVEYCAAHQAERYAGLAFRAISAEFVYRGRPSFAAAIPGALRLVEDYARDLQCDVEPLRAALEAEARSRGIAA